MAKQWKCARCSAKNPETTLTCGTCRMIRGAVVVTRDHDAMPVLPTYDRPVAAPQTTEPTGPGASEWAVHAHERPRLLRPVPFLGLVFLLFVAAVGVAVWFEADRAASGEIVDGGNLTVDELRIGDCFDVKTEANEFADVTARPCSDAHQYEVFWTGSMADGAYPSEDSRQAFFDAHCFAAFRQYLDVDYQNTRLDIYWLVANENAWTLGARYMHCAVYDPSNSRLTESLRGVGPVPALDPENQPVPL